MYRNRLVGLPVEFIDVLETVENVNITNNPWTDLPASWFSSQSASTVDDRSISFMSSQQQQLLTSSADNNTPASLFGYDVSKVLEYLYNFQPFFYIAEEIWNNNPTINLNDFISQIKQQLNKNYISATANIKGKQGGNDQINKNQRWRDDMKPYAEHVYFKVNDFLLSKLRHYY